MFYMRINGAGAHMKLDSKEVSWIILNMHVYHSIPFLAYNFIYIASAGPILSVANKWITRYVKLVIRKIVFFFYELIFFGNNDIF
jgi:hypothetical protein